MRLEVNPPAPPHNKGAAMSVMSSGKPHQSHGLQTWSCVQWLGPDLVHHISDCAPLPVCLTLWHIVGPAVAATACG